MFGILEHPVGVVPGGRIAGISGGPCRKELLMAGRRLVLLVSVFAASMAVVVVAAPAPKPDERRLPREVQEARAALERLRRRAADPKVKPEEVWKEYLALRLRFSGTRECVQAAEVMNKVPSPLDKLDRNAIPPEDRPPWLPKEVVAVLGEHRGRHWRPIRSIKFSKDGRQVISTGDDGVRTWDVATLQERTFRPLDDSEHDVPLGSDGKRYLRRAITSLTGAKSWRFTEFRYVLDLVERGAGKPAMLASLHRDLRFIRGVTATPDGQVVIASEEDWSDLRTRKQSIGVWDRKGKTYQLRCQLDIARTGGTQVQLALRGKILVDNGDEHAALRVWDISAGKPRLLKRLSSP